MKKRLLGALIAFVLLLTMFPGTFTVRANAASKPAAVKKKVTLYTDSPKYKIELKNVAEGAKLSYKSSNKAIITVKKGKVTPKAVGKAKVTVTVKQNGKTYSVKITFTVKERAKTEDPVAGDPPADNTGKDPSGGKTADIPEVTDYSEDVVNASNDASLFRDERTVLSALKTGKTENLSGNAKALYERVTSLAAKLKGKTEYATVKNIHDYLVNNIAYTFGGQEVHTLDCALNTGKCVCDGYAKAFFFLCTANDIEAILIGGTAWDGAGSELHAWNKVRIDGKWYSIDVTWDDPVPDTPNVVRYEYFLIRDEDIANDHKWDDKGIPDAVLDDLGIIYKQYEDYEKFEDAKSGWEYVSTKLNEFARNKARGTSLKLNVLVKGDGDAFIDNCIRLTEDLYNTYGCGYSYYFESAGFYGVKCDIELFY